MRHPLPRGPRDYTFQKLQQIWDERLRRSGFVDIERGVDLSLYPASTFKQRDRTKRGRSYAFVPMTDTGEPYPGISLEAAIDQATTTHGSPLLADAPTAAAWRKFQAGAHRLPDGPTKNLLLSIAEEGCISAAVLQRHRKSRQNARTIFAAHCRRLKLPPNKLLVPGRTKRAPRTPRRKAA
jgi:hypothetical protein